MSMINLVPMNGYVLVELTEEWEGVYTPDKKYDTKTSGNVIITDSDNDYLKGKKVYFEGFKDDSQVKENDKVYAFIDINDIRGYKSE